MEIPIDNLTKIGICFLYFMKILGTHYMKTRNHQLAKSCWPDQKSRYCQVFDRLPIA